MAPRHTNQYSEDQKTAILQAMVVDRHTGAMTAQMAAAGQLGVPAFEIKNMRYLYQLVKRRREGFENVNEDAMANSTRAELKRLHALNLARARKLDGQTDVAENARVAKALAETYKALNTQETKREKPKAVAPTEQSDTKPHASNDPLTNLLDLARHSANANTKTKTGEGAQTGSLTRAQTGVASSTPDLAG